MLAPGEFTRATEPLEATLAIHPTLVLTNALPYVVDIIVWQAGHLHSPDMPPLTISKPWNRIFQALNLDCDSRTLIDGPKQATLMQCVK